MSSQEVKKNSGSQYLSFTLNGQPYALPIFSVVEINQMNDITPVPESPTYVKGVLNLRGKIIPVIDLRVKFNLPASEYTKQTCIIVIESRQGLVGLIVDSVHEVIELSAENVEASPKMGAEIEQEYISGMGKVGDAVVILLDVQRMCEVDPNLNQEPVNQIV